MPGRCDEILDPVIAGTAQGAHEGFCLVEMAHPVVTPMHDIDRDVPQSGDIVENVVVVAAGLAFGIEKPTIDHVVDHDPGDGQGVFLVRLAVTVFIVVEAGGGCLPVLRRPMRLSPGAPVPPRSAAAWQIFWPTP